MNYFEVEILKYIHSLLSCNLLDIVFTFITTLGNKGAIWIVMTLILLIFPKTRRAGICAAISLIMCLFIGNLILKPMFARVRPYDFDAEILPIIKTLKDFSFPSGHTLAAFAFASAVGKYFSRAKGALYTAATLMGISRIYLCVHYPTDVIFGAALGIFFGIVSFTLTQKAGEKI